MKDQIIDYRGQIERCNNNKFSADDQLQNAKDDKLKCEKKLVESEDIYALAISDMESSTVTELNERCEKEKAEILAEKIIAENEECSAEEMMIQKLKSELAAQITL